MVHKDRQKVTDIYKVRFRPHTASTNTLISGREIEFDPYPEQGIDYRQNSGHCSSSRADTNLKHQSQSVTNKFEPCRVSAEGSP